MLPASAAPSHFDHHPQILYPYDRIASTHCIFLLNGKAAVDMAIREDLVASAVSLARYALTLGTNEKIGYM